MDQAFERQIHREFEWLHRHPETAMKEVQTTAHIREFLRAHDIGLLNYPLDTGAMAVIRGGAEKPVVALRADIDALPIGEKTSLLYRSENAGCMHACGHDFHTAALLGAALLLKQRRHELKGTVKLLFQPAEEAAHGAERMAGTGLLDDVDLIFGLHVEAQVKPGLVLWVEGPGSAAVDKFVIELDGVGCHAASPHLGADPIVAAAGLIGAFQTIVSRNIDPFSQAVISVTHIEAGDTWNVLPAGARMEGTVRTLDKAVRQAIQTRMAQVCESAQNTYGVKATFHWLPGAPSTDNDPALVDFVRKTARSLGLETAEGRRSMGGEDFSVYQEFIKGAFFKIGVGGEHPGHSPAFAADPSVLPQAASLMAAIGERALLLKP